MMDRQKAQTRPKPRKIFVPKFMARVYAHALSKTRLHQNVHGLSKSVQIPALDTGARHASSILAHELDSHRLRPVGRSDNCINAAMEGTSVAARNLGFRNGQPMGGIAQ